VFGLLVKQYKLDQTADEADWVIWALRTMKKPGIANMGQDIIP